MTDAIEFKQGQKLEDHWAGVAPYGFTKDGEIADGMAYDKFGDPVDASEWDSGDFYDPANQFVGYTIPGYEGPLY